MVSIPIYNREGKAIDTVKLDPAFTGTINSAVIYQVIKQHRSCQRKGLASTKTRGEVSGGGRKPWRQKGTGRARVGSNRSPLWRHGGVVFGPHPRDFSYTIPDKIKKQAFQSAVRAKIKENNFIVLDTLAIDKPKTKEAAAIFSNLKLGPGKGVLLLLDNIDNNLRLAFRNIGFLTINRVQNTNTYEILAHQKLVTTKGSLKGLTDRLKGLGSSSAH